jgi:hypothetical protein
VSGVWPWIVAVAVVGLALVGWRWQQRMTARCEAWLKPILDADREIRELERMFQQTAREPKGDRHA